jgi:hypothetical protein
MDKDRIIMEKRYYVIDLDKADSKFIVSMTDGGIGDKRFMRIAEQQGTVYSEEGFVEAFNWSDINSFTQVLRIIDV